jgi:hypothetical protein
MNGESQCLANAHPHHFHRQAYIIVVGHIEAPPGRSFRWALAFGKSKLGVVILDQVVALGRSIRADDPSDAERARMAHQFLQHGLFDPPSKDATAHAAFTRASPLFAVPTADSFSWIEIRRFSRSELMLYYIRVDAHERPTVRTTVTIEDDLYQRALEVADPGMDKADLFREAMKVFVRVQAGKRLSALGGRAPQMKPIPRRRPV